VQIADKPKKAPKKIAIKVKKPKVETKEEDEAKPEPI
jgi:hypothetical protein